MLVYGCCTSLSLSLSLVVLVFERWSFIVDALVYCTCTRVFVHAYVFSFDVLLYRKLFHQSCRGSPPPKNKRRKKEAQNWHKNGYYTAHDGWFQTAKSASCERHWQKWSQAWGLPAARCARLLPLWITYRFCCLEPATFFLRAGGGCYRRITLMFHV